MDTKETTSVYETVLSLLHKMMDEDELDEPIEPHTYLAKDLGLESIDIVVLGTMLQKQYSRNFPFSEFLFEVGKREIPDIRVDEFVNFVKQHFLDAQTVV